MIKSGALYLVSTPIGNLGDITLRALEVLKSVDTVLAEDTRHSQSLLRAYQIDRPLESLHEYNETEKAQSLVVRAQAGEKFALISDAGTPLLSDPGFILVRAFRAAGISVVPIPGASALLAALAAGGLPSHRFRFVGFLPAKASARRACLKEFIKESDTGVLYESTHRIVECLEDIQSVLGLDRTVVLAKELTKSFEAFVSGKVSDILQWLAEDAGRLKGEFVLLIAGNLDNVEEDSVIIPSLKKLLEVLLAELPLKQAVKVAADLSQRPKNDVYRLALTIKGEES